MRYQRDEPFSVGSLISFRVEMTQNTSDDEIEALAKGKVAQLLRDEAVVRRLERQAKIRLQFDDSVARLEPALRDQLIHREVLKTLESLATPLCSHWRERRDNLSNGE